MSNTPARRKEDKLIYKFGKFFYRTFFMIGVAAVISMGFFLVTLTKMFSYVPPPLPDKILLTYTLSADLVEVAGRPSFDQPLLRPVETLHEITESLQEATKDSRVKGVLFKMQDPNLSLAQVQELRRAIKQFRASGKFAMIYAEDIAGLSGGMADYYLASAFDEIWLQPVGGVAVSGIAMEVPFLKNILDKIGVRAEFSHQGRYKSAPESLTRTTMSADNREMSQSLVDDLADQAIADIAADRKLDKAVVKALVNRSPFTDVEALQQKLIDHVGYQDEAVKVARDKAGIGADDPVTDLPGYSFVAGTINLNKGVSGYLSKLMRKEAPPSAISNKKKIALIYGSGEIVPYGRQTHASFGEKGLQAEKIVKSFKDAAADTDVAAIVFRIDSPGGAPGAAETIRRAVIKAQEKGKPVIVSMGTYAASGGYWIAAPADKIVAEPATLTGSIGVFGGKMNLTGLWDKLGIGWDSVSVGDNARMWSANQSFTPEQYAQFDRQMAFIYDAFISRVAEGRKMTKAQVEAVAQGRVYTGRQALDKKLVDELGGLDRAIELAKVAGKIEQGQDVVIVRFPKQKSTLEMFISLATEGAFMPMNLQTAVQDALQQSLLQPVILR